ncbi:MAG TPA: acetyl/propionyl-CoA carboxylase subunit alpha, partial [Gammaproteobacteria bacterium]|nr:acetyl/propionyl-CoA carboxylase subunit alpha [Gammaproteobacteria bacterium]
IAQVVAQPLQWHLSTGGRSATIRIVTPQAAKLLAMIPEKEPPDMSKFLLSPMPGLLVRLNVAVGEKVEAGQELAVVEAMKMENSLRAEQDGIIAKCLVETGQNLVSDQAIIEFE